MFYIQNDNVWLNDGSPAAICKTLHQQCANWTYDHHKIYGMVVHFFDQKNGDFSATVPAVADMPSPGFNTVLVVRP